MHKEEDENDDEGDNDDRIIIAHKKERKVFDPLSKAVLDSQYSL